VLVDTCNSSTEETEAGESLEPRNSRLSHNKTSSHKQSKKISKVTIK
jgi:hypothetical protein